MKDDYSRIFNLWIISFTTLFFYGRMPFVLQLSILSSFLNIFLLLRVFNFKFNILLNKSKEFVKKTFLFILLILIYIFIFLVYHNHYEIVLKEIIYAVYVVFILFEIHLIKDKINYKELTKSFVIVYLCFLAVLIFGLYYSLLVKRIWGGMVFNVEVDYNFLSLTLLLGFLVLFLPIFKNKSKRTSLLMAFYAFLITLQVLFSASRRGIVVFIILNIGILLYQIIYRRINGENKPLRYYYAILLATLVMFMLAFQFSGKALRIKFIDNLFENNSEVVKKRITSVFNRYESIINNDPKNYSKTYKQFWAPEKFPEISFIDGLYGKKLKKKLWKEYKQKEYGDAWNYICDLVYFSPYNQFKNALPEIYTDLIPEEFYRSNSFERLPYILPLPFIEKEFLSVQGLDNLFLIDYPKKNKDLNFFKFISKEEGYGYFTALLPDVVSTQYQIPISLKGVSKENIKIELLNRDNIVLKNVHIKTFNKNNDFEVYKIVFDNEEKGGLKLKFSVNLKNSDTLTIIDPQIIRTPKLENAGEFNISKIDDFYLNRKQNRNRYHSLHLNRYINSDFARLSPEEVKQLHFFIDNQFTFLKPEFKNYGRFSVKKEEFHNDSSFTFYSPDDKIHARAYARLTAIPGVVYNLRFNVKSPIKPDVKLKRYPELSGNFLIDSIIGSNIEEKNGLYHIDFSYKVINSSSCLAAFIVGVRNAEKGMEFSISDVEIECQNTNNSVELTRYNYNNLKSKIELTNKKSLQENIKIENEKINQIKRNLRKGKKGFADSRWLRWKIAYYLFEERNALQKLFGKGFDYLKVYNNVFWPGENDISDYPHNPIISSVLYSGIVGGFYYVFFLIISLMKYWKSRRHLIVFTLFYIISFVFAFFSGNSHFSVPAFTLLSLLPFIFDFKQEEEKSIPKVK